MIVVCSIKFHKIEREMCETYFTKFSFKLLYHKVPLAMLILGLRFWEEIDNLGVIDDGRLYRA